MKKIIVLNILILFSAATFSQTPHFQWAKGSTGNNNDNAYGVATDPSGNVFIAGYFISSTITFGSFSLTNAGSQDIYLVKYDASGNVLWAKSAGGTGFDDAFSVATDLSGNVFITGMFSSPSINFDTVSLTNLSGADMYLAKYDANGNALWAVNTGGSGYQSGQSVATDIAGDIYVAGIFVSPTISFGSTTFNNAGLHDMFLAKYKSNGALVWARSAGGTDQDLAASVTTDVSGNVYVTGNFESPTLSFGSVTITKRDTCEMFIVKYNTNGTALWARNAGTTNADDINCVVTDPRGNVYVTGNFSSHTMTFGGTSINNSGSDDWYILKFNTGGNLLWAKSEGGTNNDDAFSIATDADGNVYVAGDFFSSSITIGTTTMINAGSNSYDACIAKYDSLGNVKWATSAGGVLGDIAASITTDAFSNTYVLGTFGSSSITLGPTTLTNTSANDIYLVKIDTASINVGTLEINKDDNGILIYPNPFSSKTTILFSEEQKNTEIKITDVIGKVIKTFIMKDEKNITLEKGELKEGIYFVQITNEMKSVVNKKIIVQ